ncbi:unnamed protein product [Boreogadus saida]
MYQALNDRTEDPIYSTPEEVEWHSPEVEGKRCALVYDHTIYPGIIQEVNETHCQVKSLCKCTGNGGLQLVDREGSSSCLPLQEATGGNPSDCC